MSALASSPVPRTVAALKRGRKAITAIEGHLDEILVWVVDPATGLDVQVVDRLAASNREAGEALSGLSEVHADVCGITSHGIY